MPERTAEQVQLEIESARDSLADAVDQLANRTNPKRLAADARSDLAAKAQSPAGKAVLGGVAVVVALLIARRIAKARSSH